MSTLRSDAGPKPGLLIRGKYRLSRPIGEGAMGVVWAALNEATSREVAIKLVLSPEPELRARFVREARACGAVQHRNIVDIYDADETESGDPFLVMPLLNGETLSALLKRKRRLAPNEAARIGRDVARGLAAAHERGVVHRDLKPSNVFLHTEPGDSDFTTKILDFGVSKILHGVQEMKTATGAMIGSPAYMSPEQVRTLPDIDHRADIWSLGILVFEMLAGVRPFQGNSQSILVAILQGEIPTVSQLVRQVDPAFSALVAKCLQRNRDQRPRSAAEIAVGLDAFTGAAPASRGSYASRPDIGPAPPAIPRLEPVAAASPPGAAAPTAAAAPLAAGPPASGPSSGGDRPAAPVPKQWAAQALDIDGPTVPLRPGGKPPAAHAPGNVAPVIIEPRAGSAPDPAKSTLQAPIDEGPLGQFGTVKLPAGLFPRQGPLARTGPPAAAPGAVADEPSAVTTLEPPTRPLPPRRDSRAFSAALMLAIALAVGGLIGVLYLLLREPPASSAPPPAEGTGAPNVTTPPASPEAPAPAPPATGTAAPPAEIQKTPPPGASAVSSAKAPKSARPTASATAAPTPSESAAPPAAAPPAPTAPFDRNAAHVALSNAVGNARRSCKQSNLPPTSGTARVAFGTSGEIISAVLSGPVTDTPISGCVLSAFRSARVPPFVGTLQSMEKSFSID